MEVSKNIIEIRRKSGMTQQQFAEYLLVTRQTISNWENDRSYPDLESLIMISDKFEVTLDELIKGRTEMVKKMNLLMKNSNQIRDVLIAFLSLFRECWLKYEVNSIEQIELKSLYYEKRESIVESIFKEIKQEFKVMIDKGNESYEIRNG